MADTNTTLDCQLNANALTTLIRVKQMLGIADNDEDTTRDTIIVNMINAASAWFESKTGRKFGLSSYVERYTAGNSQELCLRQYPIVSIKQVKDTADGSVIDPSAYSFAEDGHIGVVWKDNGWAMRSHKYGLANDPCFSRRYLQVEYTAGYVLPKDATPDNPQTLPSDIESVIWEMAQQQYKLMQDGASNLASFSISDVSWTWDKNPKATWLDAISAYKRWS